MKDKIKELIDKMNSEADLSEFEKAQETMMQIKEELKNPVDLSEKYGKTFEDFMRASKETTVKDVYDLITGDIIRLNPESYNFSKFLLLIISVYNRKKELKDTYNERKVVAEEMACNSMTVPTSRKGKKPNRAFLDIAAKVNPSISCHEILRREKVKLWKAIEEKDEAAAEKIKKEVKKYRER